MMIILQLLEIYFFCHIKTNRDIPANTKIVDVPTAIIDRLIYKSCYFMRVTDKDNSSSAAGIAVGLRNNYLYSSTNITENAAYIVGFYYLKDI